jgi:hypothetical protein
LCEFTNPRNYNEDGYGCGRAAFPYLSIAGAVVAVGLVVAFWGEGRGRLLRMAGVAVLVPGLIQILGLMGSRNMALLTHPWVGSAGQDGSVAGEAEHGESDQGVG